VPPSNTPQPGSRKVEPQNRTSTPPAIVAARGSRFDGVTFTTVVTGNEPWRSAAQTLLDEAGCTWSPSKSSNTGRAKVDGSRRIVAPEPRGRVSFAVFAHEVGHVVRHTENRNNPRWREEVEADEFALEAFTRFGLPGRNKQKRDDASHIAYAFDKAIRRGADPALIRRTFPAWWKATADARQTNGITHGTPSKGASGAPTAPGRAGS
jgi:hypothetical protein